MTAAANGPTTNLARFQDLLRELFQFDCADLDFGIIPHHEPQTGCG